MSTDLKTIQGIKDLTEGKKITHVKTNYLINYLPKVLY